MITAILALVTAAVEMGSNIIKSNAATLSAMLGANQARVNDAVNRENNIYSNYTYLLIGLIVSVLILVAAFAFWLYKK